MLFEIYTLFESLSSQFLLNEFLQLIESVVGGLLLTVFSEKNSHRCLLGDETTLDTKTTCDVVAATEILVLHETPSSLVPFDFVAVDS